MMKTTYRKVRSVAREGGIDRYRPVRPLPEGIRNVFYPVRTFDHSVCVVITEPGLEEERMYEIVGGIIPLWADRAPSEPDCSGVWFGPEPSEIVLSDGRRVFICERTCDC